MADLDKLYEWFKDNRGWIIREHKGQNVLLKDNAVIGYYNDMENALLDAERKGFHVGEFLVQRCITEQEDCMYYYNQAVCFG